MKLRDRWPAQAAEPLVAPLDLHWEWNGAVVEGAVEGVLRRAL